MAGGGEGAEWLLLRAAPGVSSVQGRRLVDGFGGVDAIRGASADRLAALGAPAGLVRHLEDPAARAAASREIERIADAGARLVTLDDAEYPPILRELRDAPLYLIAKGEPLLDGPAIAIVGARRATPYGLDAARQLAAGLADAGIAVVSGLARGIDGAAHEGALAGRGRTVAVLGSGIDVIYPAEHTDLAARIVAEGTLLSEHPVGTAPLPTHFPARNRILAGMTQGTIVIEAAERSGSLITARLANEHGREVFAVPGRVDSPLSAGAHLLIRDGATLVRDVDDVLAEVAPALRSRASTESGRGRGRGGEGPAGVGSAERVIAALTNGPASADDLIRQISLEPGEILAVLLDLELSGVLRQVGGRQFQLTGRFAGVGGLQ
jgi:DNA processing protein